jgi:hypothetical protein
VLQLPDFNCRFIVNCDASGSGFGAVLHQDGGPIAFYSRPVAPRHAKLAAYERELIGLVQAVRHWRPYLWARPFTVRTDHYALKFLLDQRLSTIPQHTWVSKLFGYDFSVEFNPGKNNTVADALSRRDEDSVAARAMSSPAFHLFDEFRREAATLPDVTALREQIQRGEASPEWSLVDGLVLHSGRVFVPSSSALWPDILATAHGTGHEGVQKTIHRLRASFYNPQAARIVRDYIKACAVCQRNKSEHLHPAGLLQPLPVPDSVWADIAMGFVEGFPRVGGKTVVLTVVDRFSKYAHFVALSHPYTAVSVARVFFDQIVRLHGVPVSIVSDRDPVFTSAFWTELFALAGVQLRRSTAFHPQTDGQSDVTNRILGVYLRCLVGDRPKSWLRWLPWAEYCYNTSYQTSLRATPFQVVYGREPPSLLSYEPGLSKVPAVDRQLIDRDVFIADIKDRLLHAQELMKTQYNSHHRHVEFAVGDWVWLRLHQRLAASMPERSRGKLSPRFYGPFRVVDRVGPVAYRLALPPGSRLHAVFHVVFLKKFEGAPPTEIPQLPPMQHGRVLPTPLKVLRARLNRGRWEVLVQWMGCLPADATWELVEEFSAAHPAFQLEDELFQNEGGSVVDSFVGRTYFRRRRRDSRQAPEAPGE